jgi:hypothetical protein
MLADVGWTVWIAANVPEFTPKVSVVQDENGDYRLHSKWHPEFVALVGRLVSESCSNHNGT